MMRGGLLTCFVLLPLALMADPIGTNCFVAPSPEPFPPGTTPTFQGSGCTSGGTWWGAYESSQADSGGDYYVVLNPYEGTLTGYTAQITFPTANQNNYADFGVVYFEGVAPYGTPEDPNNPNVITWDASHQVETITVTITQVDVNYQAASIVLPAGTTALPQITFLDITGGQIQDAPEPSSFCLAALGALCIPLSKRLYRGGSLECFRYRSFQKKGR